MSQKNFEEKIKEDNPELFEKVSELAKRDKIRFNQAFNLILDKIKAKDPSSETLKKYQKIKGENPELITQQDIQELFNDPQLGRIYYDDQGKMHIEGEWMNEAISLGPMGTPILSDNIVAYDANYLRAAASIAQRTFERFNLGIIKVQNFIGGENYGGVVDPTTAALLAVMLKGKSEHFSDEEFKRELRERVLLSFAHEIQTAQTTDDALQRLQSLPQRFTRDLDGIISGSIDQLTSMTHRWWEFSEPVGEDSRFPKLHQYLRGELSLQYGNFLFADRTGSGKTGSIVTHHFLKSDRYRKEEGRGARMLVIAPPVPASEVWAEKVNDQGVLEGEINDFYAKVLERPREKIVFIEPPKDRERFDEEMQKQLLQIEDGGIVVVGTGKLSYEDPSKNPYLESLMNIKGYDLDYFDTIAIDECQLIKNKSNRTHATQAILDKNPRADRIVASATPAEKDINDLRNLMNIRDPENVQDARAFDLNRDINAVREQVYRRRAMIFNREDLSQAHFMPEIEHQDLCLIVPDHIRDEYLREWAQLYNVNHAADVTADEHPTDNVKAIESIHKMLRILMRGKMQSRVWDEEHNYSFEDFVKLRSENDQLFFYTKYHEGVEELEKLLSRLGITYVSATGDKTIPKRGEDIELYRQNKVQALIAIDKAVDSGIKIISYEKDGGKPISMFFMSPPQSAGSYEQLVGRSDRIGQIGKVSVYRPMSILHDLERQLEPILEGIKEEFDVDPELEVEDVAEAFNALDVSAFSIIDRWRQIFAELMDRNSMNDLQQMITSGSAESNFGLDLYNSLLRLMIFDSPHRIATNFFKTHNGVDFNGLKRAQGSSAWKRTVQCYNHNWEYSASAYALNTLKEITDQITQSTGQIFDKRIDMGSGAAYASRAFKLPFVSLDMDPLMLEVGKEIVDDLVTNNPEFQSLSDNEYLEKTIQDTGISFDSKEDRFDLAISSYVWHYQAQRINSNGEVLRQLEDAMIEANRILKIGGWMFAPLPWSLRRRMSSFNKVCNNVQAYGFESTILSGVYEPQRCRELVNGALENVNMPSGGSSRGFLLFALKKVEEYTNEEKTGNPCDYAMYDAHKIELALGEPKLPHGTPNSQQPAERRQMFDNYQKENGETIASLVGRL